MTTTSTDLALIIPNIEDAEEGYTRGYIAAPGVALDELPYEAVGHLDIPAHEDPERWRAGLDAEVAQAGWMLAGPINRDLGVVFVRVAKTTISHTETFHGDISALGMSSAMDETLRTTLDDLEDTDRDRWHEIDSEINDAITAKIREHGVDTDTGKWLGQWSAEDIVRGILTRHGVTCP